MKLYWLDCITSQPRTADMCHILTDQLYQYNLSEYTLRAIKADSRTQAIIMGSTDIPMLSRFDRTDSML